MRNALKILQLAFADDELTEAEKELEIGSFELYSVHLPAHKYPGLINKWYVAILLDGRYKFQGQAELLKEVRQLVTKALQEKKTPLVAISDDHAIRLEASTYERDPVFFLDKEHLQTQSDQRNNPRYSPIIKKVKQKLERNSLSALFMPYHPDEPAADWRFFGRNNELEKLVGSTESFFIAGIRKIGKTSLLREVERRLLEKGHIVHYVTVQHLTNIQEAVEAIVKKLSVRDAVHIYKRTEIFKESLLESVLRKISSPSKPVTLILDEFGNLIKENRKEDWQVIGLLRDFVQSGRLRLIMSGYQELFVKQYDEFNSPFVNFVGYMKLKPFSDAEITELIVEPLKIWGTINDKSSFVSLLASQFGRQPYLLQHVGRALFRDVLRQGGRDAHLLVRDYLNRQGIVHFREPVETLFDNIKSTTERFLFLYRCQQADEAGQALHNAEITDSWIKETLESRGYKSNLDGRRFILNSMEMHGFTVPVDGGGGARQRIGSPIFYTFKKKTDPDELVQLINTLGEEISNEAESLTK